MDNKPVKVDCEYHDSQDQSDRNERHTDGQRKTNARGVQWNHCLSHDRA